VVPDSADSRSVVIIYKDKLLPRSQTFVLAQAEALERYVPVYVGARLVAGGLSLPQDRSVVVNRGGWVGRMREEAFYRSGWSPRMMHFLKARRPKLLHCHFGPDGVRAMRLAKRVGVPFLITFHGYDATITPGKSPDWRHRVFVEQKMRLAHAGSRFLAVSQYIRQKLLAQGFPEERVLVHYIGIDTGFFSADPSVAREPVVLFVGRLVEKKGCEYLIRAVGRLRNSHPQVRLVIIGDGPLRSQLRDLAEQHCPSATFLGAQSPNEIRNWLNRASVFCVPSVTAENGDQEGFGLVFAEAQAMGVPVVSFASAGVPEAVAHGSTGFLVPERDEEGLAHSIMTLLNDKQAWQVCSTAGVARVRKQFDLRRQTRVLEEIYSAVASEAAGHASELGVAVEADSRLAVL